jgi:hypothetical protein
MAGGEAPTAVAHSRPSRSLRCESARPRDRRSMKNRIVPVLATLFASSAAYGLPPKDCPASTRAWMPTGAEMAAACSFELLFKESFTELGSEHSCHYDFGKLAEMPGLDLTRDAQQSAEGAVKGAVAIYAQMPGYSGEAKKDA